MKLSELEPRWYGPAHPAAGVVVYLGVTFICPHCSEQRIAVPFDKPICVSGVPDGFEWPAQSPAWKRIGTTFDTLSLEPSVDCSGCGHWHGFVTNGEIR